MEEEFDITQFHSCDEDLYWYGCYDNYKGWDRFITPESYAHPAKMASKLCNKIVKHLKKLCLLKRGATIIDFMAGTNTTGIIASLHGFDSVAIELEPHFIKMIKDNKKRCEKTMQRKLNWKIIQGDSRRLSSLLKKKGLVGITSPPYCDVFRFGKDVIDWSKGKFQSERNRSKERSWNFRYSSNPNNIANLSDKKLVGITSPPYTQSREGGGLNKNLPKSFRGVLKNHSFKEGKSNGQIGNLTDNKLVGITSPPYQDIYGASRHGEKARTKQSKLHKEKRLCTTYTIEQNENIGNLQSSNKQRNNFFETQWCTCSVIRFSPSMSKIRR